MTDTSPFTVADLRRRTARVRVEPFESAELELAHWWIEPEAEEGQIP